MKRPALIACALAAGLLGVTLLSTVLATPRPISLRGILAAPVSAPAQLHVIASSADHLVVEFERARPER